MLLLVYSSSSSSKFIKTNSNGVCCSLFYFAFFASLPLVAGDADLELRKRSRWFRREHNPDIVDRCSIKRARLTVSATVLLLTILGELVEGEADSLGGCSLELDKIWFTILEHSPSEDASCFNWPPSILIIVAINQLGRNGGKVPGSCEPWGMYPPTYVSKPKTLLNTWWHGWTTGAQNSI